MVASGPGGGRDGQAEQRVFRALGLFRTTRGRCIPVTMHLSKPIERAPRMSLHVMDHGSRLKRVCQPRLMDYDKCGSLWWGHCQWGGYALCGVTAHGKSLSIPISFAVDLKLFYKIKPIFRKHSEFSLMSVTVRDAETQR